ncbi:phage tail assembly chaperone [Methylobacterium komagatae]
MTFRTRRSAACPSRVISARSSPPSARFWKPRSARVSRKTLRCRGGGERGLSPAPSRPFPWDEALAFALGRLFWRPADFWAATPREFAAALPLPGGNAPLSRAAFEGLLAAHPDPSPAGNTP